VTLQERVQEAELSAARSNAILALLVGRVQELEMSQRLTTARLSSLPANTINLTVEAREELIKEVGYNQMYDRPTTNHTKHTRTRKGKGGRKREGRRRGKCWAKQIQARGDGTHLHKNDIDYNFRIQPPHHIPPNPQTAMCNIGELP